MNNFHNLFNEEVTVIKQPTDDKDYRLVINGTLKRDLFNPYRFIVEEVKKVMVGKETFFLTGAKFEFHCSQIFEVKLNPNTIYLYGGDNRPEKELRK